MLDVLFWHDMWLDRWSLFHILLGIVIWYAVQHTNHAKITKLHTYIADEFIDTVEPYLKKLPKKVRKHIDLHSMTQPLWHAFDIHSVLMVAFFREALEMYLEQGQIIPWFTQLIPGQEHWVNRLILDPLMLIIGYRIARAFPRLFRPAVVCSAWLFSWLVL